MVGFVFKSTIHFPKDLKTRTSEHVKPKETVLTTEDTVQNERESMVTSPVTGMTSVGADIALSSSDKVPSILAISDTVVSIDPRPFTIELTDSTKISSSTTDISNLLTECYRSINVNSSNDVNIPLVSLESNRTDFNMLRTCKTSDTAASDGLVIASDLVIPGKEGSVNSTVSCAVEVKKNEDIESVVSVLNSNNYIINTEDGQVFSFMSSNDFLAGRNNTFPDGNQVDCFRTVESSSSSTLPLTLTTAKNDAVTFLPLYSADSFSVVPDSQISIRADGDLVVVTNSAAETDATSYLVVVNNQPVEPATLPPEVLPNPLQCTFCGKVYRTYSRLDRHLVTHSDERPYSCDTCDKKFKRPYELKIHVKIHTNEKKFICDICGHAFTQKHHLTIHRRRHLGDYKYICSLCQKGFHSKDELQSHKNTQHNQNQFVCNVCSRAFANKKNFSKHKHLHDPSFIPERKYQCETCGKAFAKKSGLRLHKMSHTGENSFECETCGKTVASLDSLKSHRKIHTGEKAFVCDVCGKAFRINENLRVHVRIHTGEKPFSCDNCGRCFTQRSTLTLHKLYHSGQRPFQCDQCPRGFVSKSLLRTHFFNAHEQRL